MNLSISTATIDLAAFREHENQGLITARTNPTKHDLIIWNYTQRCQYENAWDDVTMQARGLITTPDGTVVARPFRKFLNIEQHQGSIPLEPFKVTEKMDGSLLIVTIYQGHLLVATRGSFMSEQAARAQVILRRRYSAFEFLPQFTYLFEVIYPENQIVVNYGNMEDIILLAVIRTISGEEVDIHNRAYLNIWPFPVVKYYDGVTDIAKLRDIEEENKEGFVIHFESGLRLKAKYSEYVRLHRLVTRVTPRVIWDLLKNNQSIDELLDRVPDEFFSWVRRTCEDLTSQYRTIEQQCRDVLNEVKDLPTRKEQAMIIMKSKHPGVAFAMLDEKNYPDAIWKLLYPQATRPFKIDEEG